MSKSSEIDELSRISLEFVREILNAGNLKATPDEVMSLLKQVRAELATKPGLTDAAALAPQQLGSLPSKPGHATGEGGVSDVADDKIVDDEDFPGLRHPVKDGPAVPIDQSYTDDYVICLEDGARLKFLKRHLKSCFDMTIDQYRKKWKLRADHPMVAPSYVKRRQKMAKNRAKAGMPERRAGAS